MDILIEIDYEYPWDWLIFTWEWETFTGEVDGT